jgi:hypothetical protein
VILSFQLADVGPRKSRGMQRAPLDPASVPGLRYALVMGGARLGGRFLPAPLPGRVGMIASWDDDAAFDRFLAEHRLARGFAGGYCVRLEPLRASGSWSALPDLPAEPLPVDDGEPVAIVTLGRMRLLRAVPFLRASARAEGQAVSDPAMLAGTGLARLPRIVATFSLWKSARAMKAYAYGDAGPQHKDAIGAHRAKPFHHESVFVRFRPYQAVGAWEGRDPLATSTAQPAAAGV